MSQSASILMPYFGTCLQLSCSHVLFPVLDVRIGRYVNLLCSGLYFYHNTIILTIIFLYLYLNSSIFKFLAL